MERRIARDGGTYTLQDFLDYYGDGLGGVRAELEGVRAELAALDRRQRARDAALRVARAGLALVMAEGKHDEACGEVQRVRAELDNLRMLMDGSLLRRTNEAVAAYGHGTLRNGNENLEVGGSTGGHTRFLLDGYAEPDVATFLARH